MFVPDSRVQSCPTASRHPKTALTKEEGPELGGGLGPASLGMNIQFWEESCQKADSSEETVQRARGSEPKCMSQAGGMEVVWPRATMTQETVQGCRGLEGKFRG